ncbi:MAG: hypothetical protein P3X22_000425 [Thermoprotei archaeon]|nr:hypothetical protein [Thermoprotei archaeon]
MVVLGYAALLDVRFREVTPRYWVLAGVPGALVSVPIYVLGYDFRVLAVYYLASIIVVAVVYVMYRFCMMGGADVLALALISVLAPIRPGSFMPFIYLAVLYSVIPGLAYQVYSGFKVCGSLDFKCAARLKYRVKAGRLLGDEGFKWWLVDVEGGCSIDEDLRSAVAKASKGDPEAYVVASPGHPYVAHLAIGYAIALVLGDLPIFWVLGFLKG